MPRSRILLVLAGAATMVAIAIAFARTGSEPPAPETPETPAPGVERGHPAAAAAPAPAAATAEHVASAEPAPAARAEVERAPFVLTKDGEALLERAKTERGLALVTAEVLAVGPVEATAIGERVVHQDLRLRILASGSAAVRRYSTVSGPLCPATSAAKFGCSSPFGTVQAGDVRAFVLGRGRPDLGAFGALLADRSYWVVFAGPPVQRPDDPVLAALPPELLPWLGRPLTNVFRARVRAVHRREPARNALQDADRIDAEVLEVVQQAGRLPLGKQVRISQAPFVAGIDLSALVVGREYWFASEDAAFWQVLHAFAPRR